MKCTTSREAAMIRPCRFAMFATLVLASTVHAQKTRTLRGTVMGGDSGVPFAGAEIRLLNSDTRVCADASGDFTLPVPATGETRIRITPVGYTPQEIVVVRGEQSMEVALGDHLFVLDEVRVIGYSASMDANRASGNSIATLTSKDLTIAPAQSIEGAMQGKIAGAFIQANSGAPGGSYQIILRGINTILGTPDPMVIVDGIVVSSGGISGTPANAITRAGSMNSREGAGNHLGNINPLDVDKIEVLRGPSASAIYGSKASNGVVIVTTKRGQAPKPADDGKSGEAIRCFVAGSGVVQIR
jgi:TonB-dependent SusC/RagA subfamily outer membrane receptor